MYPVDITSDQIQIFILVFIRVITIVSLLPVFGSSVVPFQTKTAFSFFITLVLFPLLPVNTVPPLTHIALFIGCVIREIAIGLIIGFASTFIFHIVQYAGDLIDTQMGFAFAQIIDPFTDNMVTLTSQFKMIIFTIVYLLMNGHYFLLIAVKKSFEIIPLFGAHFPIGDLTNHVVGMSANLLILSLQLAAPILIVLLITSFSFGIIARTVPQLNIFFIGLPLQIFTGLVTIIIALPILTDIFKRIVNQITKDLFQLLYLMS